MTSVFEIAGRSSPASVETCLLTAGAVKTVTAARLALAGSHKVTLEQVIETMRQTGAEMRSPYRGTSLGGQAQNVTEG